MKHRFRTEPRYDIANSENRNGPSARMYPGLAWFRHSDPGYWGRCKGKVRLLPHALRI